MRLIDADALANALFDQRRNYPQWVANTIGEMPDAVVRCNDCKYRFVDGDNVRFNMCLLNHNKVQPDDWFCADGVRKE